ncbi:GIY-YIG nuclease family protein [Bradyrhizobium sp. CIR3A]|uniref:GIY-YIG nuclease family protein n=1 Tax=unclassified Bradyrhizobium TaxID=2631580 RepID=UPI00390CCA54
MYYVYILASRHHGTLYIGVTNSLQKRLEQHQRRQGLGVRQALRRAPPRLHRGLRASGRSDCPRKTAQALEARLEDRADRAGEPRVAGSK